MANLNNIFLIGPAGVGKTTVGRLLATQLGLHFLDTDMEIEARSGVDISWIFDIEGEGGFRDRESKIIQEFTERNGILLATGGGAVLREENRKRLVSRGMVVYLQISLEQQITRVAKDTNRPLLKGNFAENKKTLEQMAKERTPFYQEVADVTFQADVGSARSLATQISEHFLKQTNSN